VLKRIGAALLAIALFLPYGCDVRPITGAWDDAASILLVGVPLLVAVAYVLHTFVPSLARFHERHGGALHGLFRAVFFGLCGAYLLNGLQGETDSWFFWVAAIAVSGGLLYWEQGRGSKAERLPLLLLVIVGLPVVYYFLSLFDTGELQVGGWVETAGYGVAVAAEVAWLGKVSRITHGG